MLRGDFHHHIDADPVDGAFVRHSLGALIDHAVRLGIQVLSITCHDAVPYDGDAERYAADRGVLLIRGMEATVGGQHVLLLNFADFPHGRCTMAEIAERKTADALVVAPHPFYPSRIASGSLLERHREVFDAVEVSGLYTSLTRAYNRHAMAYAARFGLPLIGNTDTHFLWQLGRTFTVIDAPPERSAVIDAIRNGRVRVETRPLSLRRLVQFVVQSRSTIPMMQDALRYFTTIARHNVRAARALSGARAQQ